MGIFGFGVKEFSAVFGLIFTAYGFVRGPLEPWISGFILNLTSDFFYVFVYLEIMLLLSSFFILRFKNSL